MSSRKNKKSNDKRVVSITEAAKINKVTRQAVYVAIKMNKLKAHKVENQWRIHLDDLEDYRCNKYSRTKSMFDGALLFDPSKGYYSVNQVAKMLNVPAQKIYYATRAGHLSGHRKGSAWVIHIDDVHAYRVEYLEQQRERRRRRAS